MAGANVVQFQAPGTARHGQSIQQELLGKDPDTWLMDMDLVEEYVSGQTPEILDCRERGRHWWPNVRDKDDLDFTEWDPETGLFVRRVACLRCPCAHRRELWEVVERKRRGDKRSWLDPNMVDATVYYKTGPNGEQYAGPQGEGHMTSKQVKRARARTMLNGVSLSKLKRDVQQRQKDLGRDRVAAG